jgi:predicted AAA+ superfamily ATPase
MIPRHAQTTALELAEGFPIVAITGPRQSGKTTLARAIFPDRAYVSLEDPTELEFVRSDPRGFLNRFSHGAVIDEAQRHPALFSFLQGLVDRRQRMGDFVLTGSQQFGLRAGISQSLAGRVGLLQLLPLSFAEMTGSRREPVNLNQALLQGGYPPLFDRKIRPSLWFPNYVGTYVERDVRQILGVRQLDRFQRFVRLCAARTGQLLNLSSLAIDCSIAQSTAREWLSVLESSYLLTRLPPYHRNFGKRLVKTPKLYFLDTGLAAWLMGIRDAATLSTHPMRGALFETWVVSEFIKRRFNAGQPAELHFWRDHVGQEIDIVIETPNGLQGIEIKSGASVVPDWLQTARRWDFLSGGEAVPTRIVYGGDESHFRDGCRIVGWREAAAALD